MNEVKAKFKNEYSIRYLNYNYKCPICGELGEYNFQAEAEFFIVEMKCHKCGHKFICSNE